MIKRELYMQQIRPFIGSELVKVLTGFRRSGKSVMLELIRQELAGQGVSADRMICFNFEQMSNAAFCTAEALYDELLRRTRTVRDKVYFFFDEIQEVKDWERCINSCRLDFDCDIYITGSNAKLLSGELSTYLGGRYVEFVIYPFSFREFLSAGDGSLSTEAAFRQYLTLGGMPFLTNLQNNPDAARQYLTDLFNSVVLKDVVRRNSIRDPDLLERIIAYAMENVGHTFSAASISKYLKSESRNVSHETVMNYLKACCDAFLFRKISREDLVGKKLLTVNEKYYIVDHGLREAIVGHGIRNVDQTLENIVCMELLRRGFKVAVGKAGDREIDFIAEKNGEKIYIQVAYLLATEDVIKREFGVYDDIRDNYPKYVVSTDEFDMSRNGVKHRNIRDFLLADEWN